MKIKIHQYNWVFFRYWTTHHAVNAVQGHIKLFHCSFSWSSRPPAVDCLKAWSQVNRHLLCLGNHERKSVQGSAPVLQEQHMEEISLSQCAFFRCPEMPHWCSRGGKSDKILSHGKLFWRRKKRKIIHLPWIWNRTYCTVPQGWGLHIVSHCLLWLDSHETRRGYKCSVHSVPLLCFLIFQVILKRIQYFYPSLYTQSITVTSLTQVLGIFINGVFQDCSKAYIGCLYGGMARPKILLNMAAQCEWAERNLNDPDHEKHVLR